MIKVVFICLGNICRSPMAEGIFKDLVQKQGLNHKILIDSAATSDWEFGNPVHPGTQKILNRLNISTKGMFSRPLSQQDGDADYFIGMDSTNIKNIYAMKFHSPETKIERLMYFAGKQADIADPYYTGNFEKTYQDVLLGCKGLLDYLIEEHQL